MNRRYFAALSACAVLACFSTIGCTQSTTTPSQSIGSASSSSEESIELTISVAASVQDAMNEVQTAYQAANPGVVITYNFGSSGSLAQQIAQGAPADLFLSASQKWMDDLEEQGEILEDSRQDLLMNALVLIVPQDNTDITEFTDFETDGVNRIAIGEPESVPAGRYAQETLTFLNLFEVLQPKLVFAKDVRQVLAYVKTGNVDAGLVYATDAKVSEQVKVVATAPAESHSPIIYPVGIVADSERTDAAQDFLEFLSSETAIAIFDEYGFTMAE